MIKVNINEGNLKGNTVIAGGVSNLLSDLYFLTSLIYGSIAREDKNAGKAFKSGFLSAMMDDDLKKAVFDTSLADHFADDGAHIKSTTAKDEDEKERLLNGLKELLDL